MGKFLKMVVLAGLLASFACFGSLLKDRELLNEKVIRMHIVANSDSDEDQAIKLKVRDAVNEFLAQTMSDITDMEAARQYLRNNLPKIQQVANDTLNALGAAEDAVVTFCQEAFDTRVYDTFRLPAGTYDSLRITIGEGEGRNWWCVVYPALCVPATSEGFENVAAGAGFSDSLSETLTQETAYEIRFFLLDLLGKLQNKLGR